jgi:hypothetical protein
MLPEALNRARDWEAGFAPLLLAGEKWGHGRPARRYGSIFGVCRVQGRNGDAVVGACFL